MIKALTKWLCRWRGQCSGQRCPCSADPCGTGYETEFPEGSNSKAPRGFYYPFGAFPSFIYISSTKEKGGTYMLFSDYKDMELWEATRRKLWNFRPNRAVSALAFWVRLKRWGSGRRAAWHLKKCGKKRCSCLRSRSYSSDPRPLLRSGKRNWGNKIGKLSEPWERWQEVWVQTGKSAVLWLGL